MPAPPQPFGILIANASSGVVRGETALSDVSAERLSGFCEQTLAWGERMDLTAARSREELVELVLVDALVLAQHVRAGQRWVDVGSGAGAPCLALAMLRPDLEIDLIEPRAKRVAFLRHVVGTQNLGHVTVHRRRVEDLERRYDVAVSRATFPPATWLRRGALLAPEVWVLLAQAEPPSLEGFEPDLDLHYTWPLSGVPRRAVRFRRLESSAG